MAVRFGIITPTINRRTLLERHLRQVVRQTYPHWRMLVVHDGRSSITKSVVEGFKDIRIGYTETAAAARDGGVTPRLEGVRALMSDDQMPDYVMFWDDDNFYNKDALRLIASALEKNENPDLLIVRVKYGNRKIPPAESSVRSLAIGEIDTASLVFRPTLAEDAYEAVQLYGKSNRHELLTFNDFLAYDFVTRLLPPRSIGWAPEITVCEHDGLRWGPFIRNLLGIAPLGWARIIGLGR
jgi:glycosyltransferase involved in cell wall biosynthesis